MGVCLHDLQRMAVVIITDSTGSNGPRFWFAGRPIHRPPYALFRRRGDNLPIEHTSQCVLGYFNYPAVTKYREKKLKPLLHPSGGVDTVGTRLSEKRLSQITPNEWFQDPYIVCILLSIAQLQQRLLQVPRSTIHKVCFWGRIVPPLTW